MTSLRFRFSADISGFMPNPSSLLNLKAASMIFPNKIF
jgi:hypothetical protein